MQTTAFAVGAGARSSTVAAPAPTSQPPAGGRALTVRMTEFAFDPKDAVAKGAESRSPPRE